MTRFNVTFEIVTPESAENGDFEELGFAGEGLALRDAIEEVRGTRTSMVGGVECIECDSSPCDRPRWVTVYNGMEYETGARESRSLHIPSSVSDASARRIARYLAAQL
jgi:hypothetical protein